MLPRGLDGVGVVAGSHPLNRLVAIQSAKHGDCRECGPGSTPATTATDLYALHCAPLPRLGKGAARG